MLDVDELVETYRKQVLEPFGLGVPAALLFAGITLYVVAAPGVASFRAQNRYAQLGIVVLVAIATVAVLLAADGYHRLDSSAWTRGEAVDGALSDNYLDDEFADLAGDPATPLADGGPVTEAAE